jgi:hypothetical protein
MIERRKPARQRVRMFVRDRAGDTKAQIVLLFAETPEARDPRRQELIAKVLDDLARLSE